MSSSIKIIWQIVKWLLVVLVCTYLISVNMELHIVRLNSPFISNSFIFTIVSGVFASMLVVLLCEMQKYFDTKTRMENLIFTQLASMYGQYMLIMNNTEYYVKNKNLYITESFFNFNQANLNTLIWNLKNVEYKTFFNGNKISQVHQQLLQSELSKMEFFLIDCNMLKIAICDESINKLQLGIQDSSITSSVESINKVLLIINKKSQLFANYVDSLLQIIDYECKGRFNWQNMKMMIDKSSKNRDDITVDGFIAKNRE